MRFRRLAKALGVKSKQDRYIEMQKTEGSFCFIHINKCGGTSVEKALGLPLIHDTARQRIDKIGRARWDALATFALIRHPYAKVTSHYKYRVKTDQTGMGDGHIGLNDWVLRAFGDKDSRYHDQPLMFQPCLHWLVDDADEMAVDHVIKLENIDTDWPTLCQTVFGRQVSLGKHNTTSKAPKEGGAEELNSAAIDVLDQHFAVDFAHFGYVRSNSSS